MVWNSFRRVKKEKNMIVPKDVEKLVVQCPKTVYAIGGNGRRPLGGGKRIAVLR